MPRDPARVDAQLVASVRDCTDGADETEIRAALSTLSPAEEKRLHRLLRDPPRSHLGPFAWADLARGTDPQIAAARELSGYYALQAERDALAALVSAARPQPRVGQPRRSRTRAPKSKPATTERAQELLGLFAYHRDAPLVARSLGVPLARLRAAGLEREFALRERDLIRALWSKHRGSEAKVAAELRATPQELREIAVERGIARELDSLRDRMRREALRRRWPQERIEQLLHRRDELRELGVLEGLEREVAVRAGVIWTSLQGKRDALDLFAKKLRLTREDALRLQKLLHLS